MGFDEEELLFGPTVAVNHALSIRAPIDFWATSDNPNRLWPWSKPHRHRALRYFTTDQNIGVYSQLIRDVTKVYSVQFTEMWKDDGMPIILPTIIPLLSWLLQLGVSEVRLFGCDMRGMNSPIHSSEPFGEEEPNHTSRWKVERVLLSHAMRRYRAEGATIQRFPIGARRCRK